MTEAAHVFTKFRLPYDIRLRAALTAILGLGGVDLVVLNLWAAPALLTATDMSAAQNSNLPIVRPAALPTTQHAVATQAPLRPAPLPPVLQPNQRHVLEPLTAAGFTTAVMTTPSTAGATQARVWFGTGNWWIGPRGRRTLETAVEQLGDDSRTIEVVGHADSTGTHETNLRISQERARAVALLLVEAGVSASRIEIVARGDQDPSSDGNDRRVEIQLRGAR
jgi:outer membrane protein OmpA-like peptidoglycan-associated protein